MRQYYFFPFELALQWMKYFLIVQASKEKEIGSKNQGVRKIEDKNIVFDCGTIENDFWFEFRKTEVSRNQFSTVYAKDSNIKVSRKVC